MKKQTNKGTKTKTTTTKRGKYLLPWIDRLYGRDLRKSWCQKERHFFHRSCTGPRNNKITIRRCLYGKKFARGSGAPSTLPSQLYRASIRKKRELGYDELLLSRDWNVSLRMLCVTRLGPARRVDSLETVYKRKSWLAPQGHPILPTEWPLVPPRAWFAASDNDLNIRNCRKTWLSPVGSGGGCLGSLGQLFSK